MIFTSFPFICIVIFLLFLYYSLKNNRYRQIVLLVFNYGFYAYLFPSFTLVLAAVTIWTYVFALVISKKRNAILLILSVCAILLNLITFKYSNQFIVSFFGSSSNFNILLPIGISFYSLQAIGYIIDVYYERILPEKNFIIVSLFMSFFPIIMAGPIERAINLFPQFRTLSCHPLKPIASSVKLILFGLFCKVIIADKIDIITTQIFSEVGTQPGGNLIVGLFLFSIQIFMDFYSYSVIAIGLSELFGIKVMNNFNHPYFAESIKAFWQKWHISLMSWFKDYLFLPLNIVLRRLGSTGLIFSIFVTFTISGLWHGASINFILWALYNSLLLTASLLLPSKVKFRIRIFNQIIVFFLITFGWLLFIVTDFPILIKALSSIFHFNLDYFDFTKMPIIKFSFFIILGILAIFFEKFFLEKFINLKPTSFTRIILDLVFFNFIVFLLFIFWDLGKSQFIYFNF